MPLILLAPTFNLFFSWPASPAFPNRPTYNRLVLPVVVCGAYPTVACKVRNMTNGKSKLNINN